MRANGDKEIKIHKCNSNSSSLLQLEKIWLIEIETNEVLCDDAHKQEQWLYSEANVKREESYSRFKEIGNLKKKMLIQLLPAWRARILWTCYCKGSTRLRRTEEPSTTPLSDCCAWEGLNWWMNSKQVLRESSQPAPAKSPWIQDWVWPETITCSVAFLREEDPFHLLHLFLCVTIMVVGMRRNVALMR